DDHFECNYLIDRNIAIGMVIVDDSYEKIPEIIPDQFLGMPHAMYTESTAPKDGEPYSAFAGSVAHIVLAREDEEVDMVTVIPADATDETPFVPNSRKTSFANRVGNTVKNKFGRRGSKFTARIVPTSVLSAMAGASPSMEQRKRMAGIRRASEVPRGTSWRMSEDVYDDSSPDGSYADLSLAESRDFRNKFDQSISSRRMSVPASVITGKNSDVESGHVSNGPTPKHSAARISDSRPPTICEEEEEHSQGSEQSKEDTNPSTPAPSPTMKKKDRPTVKISTIGQPAERKEAVSSPPMTPKSILKNRGEGSQPSSRCHSRSEPPSRDPPLAPKKEHK
ncbi:hypothetical protein PMAYCL1PPCAC_18689, partial [Pristionchus mayeri]